MSNICVERNSKNKIVVVVSRSNNLTTNQTRVLVYNVKFKLVRTNAHQNSHILYPNIKWDSDEGGTSVNEQSPGIISKEMGSKNCGLMGLASQKNK